MSDEASDHEVVLDSPHPPSEVQRRLGRLPTAGGVQRAYLQQLRRLLSGELDDRVVARRTETGWRVWFVRTFIGYPNVPVLDVDAHDRGDATRLTGRFTTPLVGKLFIGYGVAFAAIFAWTVVTGFGSGRPPDAPALPAVLPLVMLPIVLGVVWRMTVVLRRADRQTVIDRLRELLDAD